MKKLIQIFMLACLALGLTSFMPDSPALVGKWKGVDNGSVGYVCFEQDGFAYFIIDGKKMGGKDDMINDHQVSMTYEVNDSIKPRSIDFILRLKDNNQEVGRLTGIYEFVNANKLKLSLDFEGKERPKKFDAKNADTIVLTRVHD